MNENSHETTGADSNNNINTKRVIAVLCSIVFSVFVIYVYKFHYPLSEEHADWGTFGDYFGGILNPVVAAFAFYLIAKTYELQKTELEATRRLLKESTDAQNKQIKLAALTALLNSNLTRISLLKSEEAELLNEIPVNLRPKVTDTRSNEDMEPFDAGKEKILSGEYFPRVQKVREINGEIKSLIEKNKDLEKRIESFLLG